MEFIQRALVIVDLETTGLDPALHEVTEIGAIRVDQESLTIEAWFTARLKPGKISLADPISLRINGYLTGTYWNTVEPMHAWQSFFAFARQSVFCSWSTRFDWGFTGPAIRNFYPGGERPDRQSYGPFDRHLIDIPSIAWGVLGPQISLSKDPVAASLGMAPEARPHRALAGAWHALEILREIRARKYEHVRNQAA